MPIGIAFPFNQSTGSLGYFESSNSVIQAVTSNVRALLLTNKGERVMQDDFGCNLREFLFEQRSDDTLKERIAGRIQEQLRKWMPFVNLDSLFIILSTDDASLGDNQIRISMKFSVGNVQGALDQVVGS